MNQNNVSVKKKRYLGPGITKRKNRWQARVRHPTLKLDITLGSFSTPEEAAAVVQRKRAEFEEMSMLKGGASIEMSGGGFKGKKSPRDSRRGSDFEGKKPPRVRRRVDFEGNVIPVGVRRRGDCRWEAWVYRPELRQQVYMGTYGSLEEASAAVEKKRAELGCMTGSKEVELDSRCKGVDVDLDDELHNRVADGSLASASKPFISNDGYLGDKTDFREDIQSSSFDEAVSLGFENKVKDDAVIETSGDGFEVKKPPPRDGRRCYDFEGNLLPVGVRRRSYRRWEAQVYCPETRQAVYVGSYGSSEEAAAAVDEKRAEFGYTSGSKEVELEPRCKGIYGVLGDEVNNRVVNSSPASVFKPLVSSYGYLDENSDLREDTQSLCFDEAVSLGFKNKLQDDRVTEMSGDDCEGKKPCHHDCRRDFEGNMLPVGVRRRGNRTWEAQIWLPELRRVVYIGNYDSPEEAAAAVDKKKAEFGYVTESKKGVEHDPKFKGLGDELKNKFAYGSPTSDLKALISTGDGIEDIPSSSFDEAVSLGFINEYGQLLGKYSTLDEQMELCLPDEDATVAGLL